MLEVTARIRLYEQSGFILVRDKRHPIWRCPCGHTQIVDSITHSEGRGDINARRRIARTLRECAQLKEEAA